MILKLNESAAAAGIRRFMHHDNPVWSFTFWAALLFYVATNTSLIPPAHTQHVKDAAAVLGFIGGWFGSSPLPSSQKTEAEPPSTSGADSWPSE